MKSSRKSDGWAAGHTAAIAAAIRRHRNPRSAQWLSDRTGELGFLITRSTITALENGQRKDITVTELLVLAAALEVPLLHLLCLDRIPGIVFPSEAALLEVARAQLRQIAQIAGASE